VSPEKLSLLIKNSNHKAHQEPKGRRLTDLKEIEVIKLLI